MRDRNSEPADVGLFYDGYVRVFGLSGVVGIPASSNDHFT